MGILKSRANAIINALVSLRESADDKQALASVGAYPEWRVDVNYESGTRVLYGNALYKCLQAHTSQATWAPTDAPSLWAKVLISDDSVIPEWVQPDSTNPYMTGDKVAHNGSTWECACDNNVWEPGVYGWTEI